MAIGNKRTFIEARKVYLSASHGGSIDRLDDVFGKHPVTEVHLSCGGGMGGSSWKLYVKEMGTPDENGMIEVTLYNGSTKKLNTRYIVEVQKKVIVRGRYGIGVHHFAVNPDDHIVFNKNEAQYYVKEVGLQELYRD